MVMTPNRRAMTAKLHIACKDLCIEDGAYREMLHALYGVESSSDLSDSQLDDLLRHLQSRGWQPKPPTRAGKQPTVTRNKEALMGKIEALLADAKLPWAYADGMARKMFKVDKVQWCGPEQLHKIVAALTYHQQRRVAKS